MAVGSFVRRASNRHPSRVRDDPRKERVRASGDEQKAARRIHPRALLPQRHHGFQPIRRRRGE